MRGSAGGRKGRGGMGVVSANYTTPFRTGKATKSSHKVPIPHHKAKEHLASNRNSFRSWLTQLVPSIGTILLTVTSQDRQNALQKSRLAHI